MLKQACEFSEGKQGKYSIDSLTSLLIKNELLIQYLFYKVFVTRAKRLNEINLRFLFVFFIILSLINWF